MPRTVLAAALVIAAIAATFTTLPTSTAQGREAATGGVDLCAYEQTYGIAPFPRGYCALSTAPTAVIQHLPVEGKTNTSIRYAGDAIWTRYLLCSAVSTLRSSVCASRGAGVPYIARIPSEPACDRPEVQYADGGGGLTFECELKTPGAHALTITSGRIKLVRWYRVDEDEPTAAEYGRSRLPAAQVDRQFRLTTDRWDRPEFQFTIRNNTDEPIKYVEMRVWAQNDGGRAVGRDCGHYGATWWWNVRIPANGQRVVVLDRNTEDDGNICLRGATGAAYELVTVVFESGRRWRP